MMMMMMTTMMIIIIIIITTDSETCNNDSNLQFGFELWTCRLLDLIIYFCIQTGVDVYNVWFYKFWERRLFWEKGGAILLQSGRTCHGVCLWAPMLDTSYCRNSSRGELRSKVVWCKLGGTELKLERTFAPTGNSKMYVSANERISAFWWDDFFVGNWRRQLGCMTLVLVQWSQKDAMCDHFYKTYISPTNIYSPH
jgi:hypothetical protein